MLITHSITIHYHYCYSFIHIISGSLLAIPEADFVNSTIVTYSVASSTQYGSSCCVCNCFLIPYFRPVFLPLMNFIAAASVGPDKATNYPDHYMPLTNCYLQNYVAACLTGAINCSLERVLQNTKVCNYVLSATAQKCACTPLKTALSVSWHRHWNSHFIVCQKTCTK